MFALIAQVVAIINSLILVFPDHQSHLPFLTSTSVSFITSTVDF